MKPLPATLLVLCAACGAGTHGAALDGGIDSPSESGTRCPVPEGVPTDGGRPLGEVPALHRVSSTGGSCPQQRGPAMTSPACGGDAGLAPCAMGDECAQDSDCSAGLNGRCLVGIGAVRYCSYDECFGDCDCAGSPCICRTASTSAEPNVCDTSGNCATDSDCGPGGWCSPSLVNMVGCSCDSFALCLDAGAPPSLPCGNACGQPAFYCHTVCDTCVNDSDCSSGRSCQYDVHEGIWDCFAVVCGG